MTISLLLRKVSESVDELDDRWSSWTIWCNDNYICHSYFQEIMTIC